MTTASDHTLSDREIRGRARLRAGLTWLLDGSRRISAVELSVASILVLVVGFGLYLTHIRHGSFYYDDWANAALTEFPPHPGYFGALSEYFSEFGFRPLLAVYVPTQHEIFGLHEHLHIAWAVFLTCATSVAFYATLRTLGMERIHAIAIAGLALVAPFSDSSTLWSTAASGHLVVTLYLLGLIAAIRGLRETNRRRALLWHLGSLILYAAAVTTYELVASVALASVLLYVWQGNIRRALQRFAADVVVVGAALIWTGTHTQIDEVTSANGGFTHVRLILDSGLTMVARALEPFGHPPRLLVIGVAFVILLAGAAGWWRADPAGTRRRELQRWLLTAIGGVLFAYIAWAMFVPSNVYYEPNGVGVGNRTNCLALLGLVTLAYSLAMIVGTLLAGRSAHRRELATGVALAATVGLGVSYAHQVRIDISNWDVATKIQNQVFQAMHVGIPRPARGSTIYAYGFTQYPALGVPSFAASWDLNGAVKVTYDDGSLSGYPLEGASSIVCSPKLLYPDTEGYTAAFGADYGHAYLVNVATGSVAHPRSQRECDRDLGDPLPKPAHS
jgi:hypothetical protein